MPAIAESPIAARTPFVNRPLAACISTLIAPTSWSVNASVRRPGPSDPATMAGPKDPPYEPSAFDNRTHVRCGKLILSDDSPSATGFGVHRWPRARARGDPCLLGI